MDAELLDETRPDLLIGAEGIGAPAVLVKTAHQQLPRELSERLLVDEATEGADDPCGRSTRQLDRRGVLAGSAHELIDPHPIGKGVGPVRQIAPGRASAKSQGMIEEPGGEGHLTPGPCRESLVGRLGEQVDVEDQRSLLGPEPVPGGGSLDVDSLCGPPRPSDIGAHRGPRVGGKAAVGPQHLLERAVGCRGTPVKGEQ
ncbi:MAG: hypothetical protein R2698_12140 [Microthrixaceae bacterium]